MCCFATTQHTSPAWGDGSGQLHGKLSMLGPGLRCAGSYCTNDALHRSSIHTSQLTVVHVTYYTASWPAEKAAARTYVLLANFLTFVPVHDSSDHVMRDASSLTASFLYLSGVAEMTSSDISI